VEAKARYTAETMPRDERQLTRRQIRALEDGSIIRVPAAIDVHPTHRDPFGDFRVQRVDEGNSDPVRHLLTRFDASSAVSLFTYATKMLRFWDGEGAVHEGVSFRLEDGMFEIPAPPFPDDVIRLIYVRSDDDELVLLGGYITSDRQTDILAATDAAVVQRIKLLGR
jgi:hypothetical protein